MKRHDQNAEQNGSAGKHRIVIGGAGPGGICMAIKLKEAGIEDFVMLERASGVGGTWFNNRYPGLSCDLPSHLYSFSFEQKLDWTRHYAYQPEIQAYMQHCVDKYGLAPHIRFNTPVVAARWDAARSEWQINTGEGAAIVADIFISAVGMFNEIRSPEIAGVENFSGQLLHTARWPEQVDLAGKTIAVIGSAASAVQLIPEIAPHADQLYLYQRTANWVLPKEDGPFSAEELRNMRADPSISLGIRKTFYDFVDDFFTFSNTPLMDDLNRQGRENLQVVADPETRRKLTPQLPLGAQRPLFSNDFYPVFNQPNVELVTDAIETLTMDGVRTKDGVERKVDTVILATGYAANKFLSVIDVNGRDGIRLKDLWREGPQAYLGITTAGFPNLFMLYGPNTNNGSILQMIECQVEYIVRKLKEMETNDFAWIDVRKDVMDNYNETVQKDIFAIDVWRLLGSKYYRSDSGRVVTQCPYNMTAFKARTSVPDLDAFETSKVGVTGSMARI